MQASTAGSLPVVNFLRHLLCELLRLDAVRRDRTRRPTLRPTYHVKALVYLAVSIGEDAVSRSGRAARERLISNTGDGQLSWDLLHGSIMRAKLHGAKLVVAQERGRCQMEIEVDADGRGADRRVSQCSQNLHDRRVAREALGIGHERPSPLQRTQFLEFMIGELGISRAAPADDMDRLQRLRTQ